MSIRALLLLFSNIFIYNFHIFLLSSIQHYVFWFPKFSLIIASKSLQKLCTDKRRLIYTMYIHIYIVFSLNNSFLHRIYIKGVFADQHLFLLSMRMLEFHFQPLPVSRKLDLRLLTQRLKSSQS